MKCTARSDYFKQFCFPANLIKIRKSRFFSWIIIKKNKTKIKKFSHLFWGSSETKRQPTKISSWTPRRSLPPSVCFVFFCSVVKKFHHSAVNIPWHWNTATLHYESKHQPVWCPRIITLHTKYSILPAFCGSFLRHWLWIKDQYCGPFLIEMQTTSTARPRNWQYSPGGVIKAFLLFLWLSTWSCV